MLQPQERVKGEIGHSGRKYETLFRERIVENWCNTTARGVKNILQHLWVYFCDIIIFDPCIEGFYVSTTREGEGGNW